MNKLILGTAQFGSDYGIKHDGQPSIEEIERIAKVAWDGGIRVIHTSWQYPFERIEAFKDFERIHKDDENPKYFWFRDKNGFKHSGYSFYTPNDGDGVFFEYSQIPMNILDARWWIWIKRQKSFGYTIHARSIFLQGLILMNELPHWVQGEARAKINLFHYVCKKEGLKPYEAALGWVLGLDEVDKVIVGVNSVRQLEQLLAVKPLKWDYDFSITDEMVLDPRRWPGA